MLNRGKVKFVNQEKAIGFIVPDDDGPDVFFHKTSIVTKLWEKLAPGASVVYEAETRDKGDYLTALISVDPVREAERCAAALMQAAQAETDPLTAAAFQRAAEICQAIGGR